MIANLHNRSIFDANVRKISDKRTTRRHEKISARRKPAGTHTAGSPQEDDSQNGGPFVSAHGPHGILSDRQTVHPAGRALRTPLRIAPAN
ncbi:MAG: hypothetical protein K2J33_00620, partial [Alistipes sp.]|nr:hypothetical protein [Alistipes sp.]